MKIEAGKYYKTRYGRKVGPMREIDRNYTAYPWTDQLEDMPDRRYSDSGEYVGMERGYDLISEWLPWETIDYKSPIRTVKRREIVAGKYGIVTIKECGFIHINTMGTPDNLREAAHILNQIAEVLQENGE